MSARTPCRACLQALRQQQLRPQQALRNPIYQHVRLLSTTHSRAVEHAPNVSYTAPRIQAQPGAAPKLPSSQSPITSRPKDHVDATNLDPNASLPGGPTARLAKEIRERAPKMTETYVAYGVCEQLIKECIKVADYDIPQRHNNFKEQPPRSADGQDIGVGKGWWYEDFGLLPTFNTWAQITFLHMYLLTTRFRLFPSDHAPTWHQHLINHFSYAAEERMTTHHNVVARMMRNRVLKDLFAQWRGIHAAYDTALVQGDTQLAAAVWRNVGKGDENVDLRRLTEVVAFVRSGCKALEGLSDEVVAKGDVIFGDPGSERDVVRVRSPLMESLGMDLRKEQSASPAKLRADPATPATPATATSDVDELERRAMESAAKTAGPA